SATSWERRDWPRCCASCVELQFDSTQAGELRPILARARKAWRAGAAPGRNDAAGTQAPARRLRIGEQDDSTERIAFEDGAAAALGQLGDAPIWSGRRQDDADRREVEPAPFAYARPRDESAVVEAVGDLGERTAAARQSRIDEFDRDPQHGDRGRHLVARVDGAGARRQIVAE